jgi:hypothetical protein
MIYTELVYTVYLDTYNDILHSMVLFSMHLVLSRILAFTK